MIFVKTRRNAEKMCKRLKYDSHNADAIHGNLRQNKRDRVIKAFRNNHFRILVGTDVASRGLDIPAIKHVINFDLPQVPEDYVHRIGRTARAGAKGIAWALVDAAEVSRLRAVERLTKRKVDVVKLDIELPNKTSKPTEDSERAERRQGQQRSRRPGQGSTQGQGQNQGGSHRSRRRSSGKPGQGGNSTGNSNGNRRSGEAQAQGSENPANNNRSSNVNGNTLTSTNENVSPYGRVGPRAGSSSDGGRGGGGTPRRRRNPAR